jgi:crotonobetainyl-CoA:carnitine CoA-transferase CaiB-like acyl-CoA transferase
VTATGVEWPLAGLRVLDLSGDIAGPYCTKLLVDAGAEVVKVEPPDGDPLRRWTASKTARAAGRDGALFQFLNASKRSVVLDLGEVADRGRLLELAARADVLVESFPAGTMARLGLAVETLQARHPALSVVSITPWGQTGPWADRPATEFTMQAAVGSIAYRGLRDRKPVAAGGRLGEWAAGTFAALGALGAWLAARQSGTGQHVDVSLFETVLLTMTIYHDLDGQWVPGPLPRAVEIPSIEPAKDGWIGFCTITGQQWKDFCALIGRPREGDDPRFLYGVQRMEHFAFMQEMIHAWTRTHTIDETIELADALRIPVSRIGTGATVPAMDHFVARGVFARSPEGFLRPRPPYQLGRTPLRPAGAAPRLGEHTDEILGELRARPAASPSAKRGTPDLPLRGLRVLDLTAFWAGPVATCYLAAMGADVVKVESIQRPDGMRLAGATVPGADPLWEWSPVFAGANPGKRAVTLNLDSADGLALVRRLIAGADVLIENYSARVMEHFGLGWDAVHALNPRAIMVRMPAFGLDGPWRDRVGFAMTLEQVSGLAWLTGYRDMPLVLRGSCDPIGGMHAVFALLMALEHRRRTGEGQLVEVPLVECALNVAAEQVIEHSAYEELLTRDENRGPCAAPQGLYACAGGEYAALAVTTDEQWAALRVLMDDPEWARDPDLATPAGRRRRHDEIDARLEPWFATQPVEPVVARLLGAGIAAAVAINAHHLMPHPQLEHRRFFQTMAHPATGVTRYPGFPMRFSAFGPGLHAVPPPLLGQHNDEILGGELGLSGGDLQALREKQVIGERPTFL